MMVMIMMIGMMMLSHIGDDNGHKDDYDDDDTVWLMDMIRGSIDRWYW